MYVGNNYCQTMSSRKLHSHHVSFDLSEYYLTVIVLDGCPTGYRSIPRASATCVQFNPANFFLSSLNASPVSLWNVFLSKLVIRRPPYTSSNKNLSLKFLKSYNYSDVQQTLLGLVRINFTKVSIFNLCLGQHRTTTSFQQQITTANSAVKTTSAQAQLRCAHNGYYKDNYPPTTPLWSNTTCVL